jgi:hypothetical protein
VVRLLVFCFLLSDAILFAQPKLTLDSFAWLEGTWSGTKEGRLNEEWFSAPKGGSISVMFRMTTPDKTMIVQVGTITEDQDGIVLRTRSFGPQLQQFGEEAFELRLAAFKEGKAEFTNPKHTRPKRTFLIRESPDVLRVRSEIIHNDGKEEVHELSMNRVK